MFAFGTLYLNARSYIFENMPPSRRRKDFHGRFTDDFIQEIENIASKTGKDKSTIIEELARKGMKAEDIESIRKLIIELVLEYKRLDISKSIEVNKARVEVLGSILKDLCKTYLKYLEDNNQLMAEKAAEQIRSLLWSIQTLDLGGISPIETNMLENVARILATLDKLEKEEIKTIIEELKNQLSVLQRSSINELILKH